jgi:hypothetical protein
VDFRRRPAEGAAFRAVRPYSVGVRPSKRLSDRAVTDIKRRALAAGLDPALFSGHSLSL